MIERSLQEPKSRKSVFLTGLCVGAFLVAVSSFRADSENAESGADASVEAGIGSSVALLMSAVTGQVSSDFGGEGDYIFLPNRRTIWVVDKSTGRFANYHFRSDQERTVMRSRVVSLNQRDFPVADTVFLLSDRNLTELLWVCNKRTGDVQMWVPRTDGNVALENQIVTSSDLSRTSGK